MLTKNFKKVGIIFSGKIHFGFTMIIYALLVAKNEVMLTTLNPIALAIGSVLPDADHKHAPAGRFIPLWLFCKHRGITHTWYACIFVGVLGSIVSWQFGLSIFLAYLLHLAMDASTPMGVKWWGK